MNLTFPLSTLALAIALSGPALAQDTTKTPGGQNDSQTQQAPPSPMPEDEATTQSQQNQPGAQPQPDEPATQSQNQPGTAQPGTDTTMSKRERDYQAAVKKCEAEDGAADRQQCIDAAKKKFGQM